MLIALIGTVLVLINDFDLSSKYTLGNIYAVLCSLCISISFLIAEKVRNTEGTIEYTRMLYGVAALTIFAIGSFYTETFNITEKDLLSYIQIQINKKPMQFERYLLHDIRTGGGLVSTLMGMSKENVNQTSGTAGVIFKDEEMAGQD